MLEINSYEEFAAHLGEEIGTSEWLTVDQDRINQFADATLDHQWIHVDVERAKAESPYKSTIVHGYLTLSLLPYFWNQIIKVNNLKMLVNYGMDKMRFGQAVPVGSRLRMVTKLHEIANLRGICKASIAFKIESKASASPHLRVSPPSSTTSTDNEAAVNRSSPSVNKSGRGTLFGSISRVNWLFITFLGLLMSIFGETVCSHSLFLYLCYLDQ